MLMMCVCVYVMYRERVKWIAGDDRLYSSRIVLHVNFTPPRICCVIKLCHRFVILAWFDHFLKMKIIIFPLKHWLVLQSNKWLKLGCFWNEVLYWFILRIKFSNFHDNIKNHLLCLKLISFNTKILLLKNVVFVIYVMSWKFDIFLWIVYIYSNHIQ